jgi:DNA primase
LGRLVPCPALRFDAPAAGQKAGARAALRALPHVAPGRSLAFATLPPGQDPDDLVRAKGREAFEGLVAAAEPLIDRLWRHELEAEPLATPEQKAGLRRRLIDHCGAIADPDVRDQYRAELLRRFDALVRPARSQWQGGPGRGRFAAPRRPASAEARAVGSAGLSPQLTLAAVQGLLRHPAAIAGHAEAVAALPLGGRDVARLRDLMLEAAMENAALDHEALHTILARRGAAALAEQLGRKRGLAFSFTRRDAEPERAQRDLVLVVETLAARPGLEAALEAATTRLKEAGDEAAFREQQRLLKARDDADRQLAALMEGGEERT